MCLCMCVCVFHSFFVHSTRAAVHAHPYCTLSAHPTAPTFHSLQRAPTLLRRRIFYLANGFSGGVFLGVGLLHMLAEAQEELEGYSYPWGFFSAGVAVLLVHLLESCVLPVIVRAMYAGHARRHVVNSGTDGSVEDASLVEDGASGVFAVRAELEQRARLIAVVLLVVVSIHSAIAGLALGVQDSVAHVGALLVAIAVHKAIEAFAICTAFMSTTLTQATVVVLMCCFSLVTPVFIILGMFAFRGTDMSVVVGFINAFAAGSFIYLSLLILSDAHSHGAPPDSKDGPQGTHVVSEHQEYGWRMTLARFVALSVGFVVMAALAIVS